MKRTEPQTTLPLKDVALSAYLLSNDVPLLSLERQGKTVYFVFGDRIRALTLCDQFWKGAAKVNLKIFLENQRHLRDAIFSSPQEESAA